MFQELDLGLLFSYTKSILPKLSITYSSPSFLMKKRVFKYIFILVNTSQIQLNCTHPKQKIIKSHNQNHLVEPNVS